MTEIDDGMDWFERARNTTDRLRQLEEAPAPNQPPKTVKRVASYMHPSGANARSMNSRNASQRIRNKRGK